MSESDYPAGAFYDDDALFNKGLKRRRPRRRYKLKPENMSYDIYLTHPDTPSHEIGNLTYNLAPMFSEAFGTYWKDLLNGNNGSACQSLIEEAIKKMETDPDTHKELEPANKWGTYESGLAFLKEMLTACEEYPNMYVKII